MKPLIKWPGGKTGEVNKINRLIPSHKRYIEPFFGGGALFFHLCPERALINDLSSDLIQFYKLIKEQDRLLYDLLICYNNSFSNLLGLCEENYANIYKNYEALQEQGKDYKEITNNISFFTAKIVDNINSEFKEKLILNQGEFMKYLNKMVMDKMHRTIVNNNRKSFTFGDLKNNLITGFANGYYMYFRKVYNDLNLKLIESPSIQYKVANFYFIREYCYGSMFRYNKKGEFNIPYGGMSYNKKNLQVKIENMFNKDVGQLLKNTEISCLDFEDFLKEINLTEEDFIFLDPPYDTEFSNYEGKDFSKADQERLAVFLQNTMARFILVIKNTDFIYNLYKDHFNILSFDNRYSYNVRSRNERNVKHLIITNVPV